jgi:phosphate/sulfate permease
MPLAAGHEENAMRFGPSISTSILYRLGWILLGVAALMAVRAILAFAGPVTLPVSISTDLIGAIVCAGLGVLSRLLARGFEGAAYPG